MKKILLVLVCLFLVFSQSIFAHGKGLPPFFKVNGTIAQATPLETVGILPSAFNAAQDMGPENYFVNEPIEFEIDTSILQTAVPLDVIEKTKFDWDFGDGTKADGLKNTHTYTKMGSYTVAVIADYDPSVPSQLIESVQVHILPNKDYQLPKAVIKIDGKKVEDPLTKSLDIDLNNKITLDASESEAPSSKIVEYIWDLGDGKTSKDKSLTHRYKLPQFFISPSLQVKDANGFISQTFIDLQNSGKNDPNDPEAEERKQSLPLIAGGIIAAIVLLAGATLLLKKKSK